MGHFFLLPRELRDRIYDLALLNQNLVFTHSNLELWVSYTQLGDVYEEYKSKNLCWLLTCRNILSEGLDQFYQHATLEMEFTTRYPDCVKHDLTIDGKKSIFELERIRSANLRLRMGKTWESRGESEYYELIVPRGYERSGSTDGPFKDLGKAIAGLERCDLKELELHVYLFRTYDQSRNWEASGNRFIVHLGSGDEDEEHNSDDDEDDEDSDDDDSYTEEYWNAFGTNLSDPGEISGFVIDFTCLKDLGTSWDKIRINYKPTYMERYWGDSDPVPANVLAVPAIEEGLAEMAKELVGGEGWAIADRLEKENNVASVWVLSVQRKGKDERTGSLEHIGLHDYLAPCDECNEREEKFHRELSEDGMVKFVGEKCGRIVEFETPVFEESDGNIDSMDVS